MKRYAAACLAAFPLLLLLLAAAVHFGSHANLSDRSEAHAHRLDRIARSVADLSARIDSAEAHAAELARVSHERRAALADELRRNIAVAATDLKARMAAAAIEARVESAALADRVAGLRRDLDAEALATLDDSFDAFARTERLAARVAALERRPTPAKVIERTVEVRVPVVTPAPVYLYPILPRRCR